MRFVLGMALVIGPPLSEAVLLRARLVQLESQLAACQTQRAAQQIEQAAGCPLDWTVNPVTCKSEK